MQKIKRKDLIYHRLCYQIIGILFEAWTDLAFGYKEKIYQRAVAQGLKNAGLKFQE